MSIVCPRCGHVVYHARSLKCMRVEELIRAGELSYSEISREAQVTRSNVTRVARQLGIPPTKSWGSRKAIADKKILPVD